MAAYKLDSWICSARKNDGKNIISLLKELRELHAEGIIDDETFENKGRRGIKLKTNKEDKTWLSVTL